MIQSQDSCQFFIEPLTRSQYRNNVIRWRTGRKLMERQKEWCRPWRGRWICRLWTWIIAIETIRWTANVCYQYCSRASAGQDAFFTWSTVGILDPPWKQISPWREPSCGIKIHVDGVTSYKDSINVLEMRSTKFQDWYIGSCRSAYCVFWPCWYRSRISSMAVPGSIERRIHSKIGAYVAWPFSSLWDERGVRGTIGICRHTV